MLATNSNQHCYVYLSVSVPSPPFLPFPLKTPFNAFTIASQYQITDSVHPVAYLEYGLWRNDGVAAASSDGGPTGGRGPPQFYFILNQRGGALT